MNEQEDAIFHGWLAHDASSAKGTMRWGKFEPKHWESTDVDIEVTHCGVCSSDINLLQSESGETSYPVLAGHEIVGFVRRVGEKVVNVKLGDRVGFFSQSNARNNSSLLDHDQIEWKDDRHMRDPISFNGAVNSTPAILAETTGGYSLYHRCPSHLVFKIPESVKSEHAAPLMCAGATVYAALSGDNTATPEVRLKGKRIGVLGIGGLGHLAIQFARAMGAGYIVGISRWESKRADVLSLGANHYIATNAERDWLRVHIDEVGNLDLILGTMSKSNSITDYLRLLKCRGQFVKVGIPGDCSFSGNVLDLGQLQITASPTPSPADVMEMLQFVSDKHLRPWVELRNMRDANDAIVDMAAGKARYRIVLCNWA